ncbi:transcriptional regulator with XRE-family HTH domain [Nocardiopsis mwathae]|uniref:Transcriptional regulator with XRE-family HTH domain n=1 Tax=Nocardiopsis mwathae TaxID=1472723 RepID=A0A7X0D6W7_9ACTN|nr:helix-turn-helix transcriptional regulator [Nocardiopsis mwathae]MBB6173705.1 transcriptional regulator with XRE-family HTH domain [Nocardiopsis mwathae]
MLTHRIDRNALRRTRERKGYSVPDLARRVGASAQHLYRIEWGQRQPSPRLYRALTEALEADEGDLLVPEPPQPPG